MQHLCGLLRRCIDDYEMIAPGDKIAVGISGGKDSLALLVLLAELRKYYPKPFSLEAMTVDMGLHMDFSAVEELCHRLHVPYTIMKTDIGPLIFDIRQEKNPCSMCAKMRRGALHNAMAERGITKIALGHHYDDAVETFLLSLFYEGRISCFQPVTYLSRTGVTQIRPMLYVGEKAALQLSLRIPEDIAIVGFDDIMASHMANPSITTVRQPTVQMGALSTEMVIKLIEKDENSIKSVILGTELVIRESTTV